MGIRLQYHLADLEEISKLVIRQQRSVFKIRRGTILRIIEVKVLGTRLFIIMYSTMPRNTHILLYFTLLSLFYFRLLLIYFILDYFTLL